MVTPYVGVWIETLTVGLAGEISKVTPYVGVWIETWVESITLKEGAVTPYVGVWIETWHQKTANNPWCSHSLCGSVDWNSAALKANPLVAVSLLMWECGLKHILCTNAEKPLSHSLCGSVDWNSFFGLALQISSVTPYVGVWIET